MILILIAWIIGALLVAALAIDKKIGFQDAFLVSILLSPVVGLIVTLLSKDKHGAALHEKALKSLSKQQVSISDEIEKLSRLRNSGDLSDEEFEGAKKKLIQS